MKTTLVKHSDQALSLMERVLRAGAPIAAEYPTVFHAGAAGSFVTIEEEGEVRAACAILARELLVPGVRLRVGLVGSVVTDPGHRSRGLGTRLVEAALDALREQGCVAALLWADSSGFYARRGWREIGSERDFILSPDDLESLPPPENVRPLRPKDAGDAEAVHTLYERHERRVLRSKAETRALLDCPGMHTLVCEQGGRVSAYACLGRGVDLQSVIHEWGGASEDVLRLVRAQLERLMELGSEADLYLMTPGVPGDLHGRLALAGVPSSVGILGLARVLDVEGLATICAQVLGPRGLVRARLVDEETIEFSGPAGHVHTSADELLDLALAARGERGLARALGQDLGVDASGLPLSPFVWGLDSI